VSTATLPNPAVETFEDFLKAEQAKDLLRFTTAGSVDDGKSTLIGRLLYDSRSVYDDQLESVTKASAGRNAGAIDGDNAGSFGGSGSTSGISSTSFG